jgi:hypothetical protein
MYKFRSTGMKVLKMLHLLLIEDTLLSQNKKRSRAFPSETVLCMCLHSIYAAILFAR